MSRSNLNVVLYEDGRANQFFPLTITRPVQSLVSGCFSIKDRILKILKNKYNIEKNNVYHVVRNEIKNISEELYEGENFLIPSDTALFINARLLNSYFLKDVVLDKNKVFKNLNQVIGFFLDKNALNSIGSVSFEKLKETAVNDFPSENVNANLVNYLWDFVNQMPEIMKLDYQNYEKGLIRGTFHSSSNIYGDEKLVFINADANIHPNVVIDTTEGPVVVDKRAEIHPFSRIEGPSYIGEDAIILGAKIRSGTYIGKKSRAGGEVENSIMQAHSNKYHEGFLGHSYIGEWVNLGALTTNSDLKNNYSEVEVIVNGNKVLTGSNKIGSFIGDHTKTSIGCLLNTGTYTGVMVNMLASGTLLPKYIPSFSNYARGRFVRPFPLKSLLDTAKIVKSRRGLNLTEAEISYFEYLFNETKDLRKKMMGKS